jgi:hypothetical protein
MEEIKKQDGFTWEGEFYPFVVNGGHPKDIVLVERIARIPIFEYERLAASGDPALSSGSMLIALMATSIRAKHPDWNVEDVERFVFNVDLGSDSFDLVKSDEEAGAVPPEKESVEAGKQPPAAGSLSMSQPPISAATPE